MKRIQIAAAAVALATTMMTGNALAQTVTSSTSSGWTDSYTYNPADWTTITLPNGRTATHYHTDIPTVTYDEATRVATLRFLNGATQILSADGTSTSSSAGSAIGGNFDTGAAWSTGGATDSSGGSSVPASVPEPGMTGIFALGTLGLVAMRRLRRSKGKSA
jgi:uncharacterized membrane protein YgcG